MWKSFQSLSERVKTSHNSSKVKNKWRAVVNHKLKDFGKIITLHYVGTE